MIEQIDWRTMVEQIDWQTNGRTDRLVNRSTVRSGLHVELMTLASFHGHSGLRMVGGGGIGLLTRPCQTLQGEFADQTVIMEKNTVFNGVFFLFFIFFSSFFITWPQLDRSLYIAVLL